MTLVARQRESGTSEHLAFDHLDVVDATLLYIWPPYGMVSGCCRDLVGDPVSSSGLSCWSRVWLVTEPARTVQAGSRIGADCDQPVGVSAGGRCPVGACCPGGPVRGGATTGGPGRRAAGVSCGT